MTIGLEHTTEIPTASGVDARVTGPSSLCLTELAQLVVDQADRQALKEILTRRKVFKLQNGQRFLLGEYLFFLKELAAGPNEKDARAISLAERAYDLTLEKFINLPTESSQDGPDCRHYYSAFLKALSLSLGRKPTSSRLRTESRAEAMLKGLVARHFRLSKLEAWREANPFWSRYQWRSNGRSLTVWMPASMSGAERRAWLEKNIPASFFDLPEWRSFIQQHVEQNLVREHFIPLDALENDQEVSQDGLGCQPGDDWGLSLAEAVAREKAQNIQKQRRAIRKLGPESLAELVRQVFLDLDAGEYEQKQVAAQFGLSEATLSRFAGTDWRQKDTEDQQVPDLWRNTAQVVSQIPMFREVAEEAGMLHRIEEIRGDE